MNLLRSPRALAVATAGLLAITLVGGAAVAQEDRDGPRPIEHVDRYPLPRLGLRAVIAASGLDAELFRAGFAEDKTVNAILEENGLDAAAVKQTVLDDLQERLDTAVANGRLTAEQASTTLERASSRLDSLMSTAPDDFPRRPLLTRWLARTIVEQAAEAIGVDPVALANALRDGQSVADVALENGVDPQQVIDALAAEAYDRIDAKADRGGWDEERVAERKARALERITAFVHDGPHRGDGGEPRGR